MTVFNYYQPYSTTLAPVITTGTKWNYFGSINASNIDNSTAISVDFSRVEALEKKIQELEEKVTLLSDLNAKLEKLIEKADQLLEKPKEVLPYVGETDPWLSLDPYNFQPTTFTIDLDQVYPVSCEGITLTSEPATWTMY